MKTLYDLQSNINSLSEAFRRIAVWGAKHHVPIEYQKHVFNMFKAANPGRYINVQTSFDTFRRQFKSKFPSPIIHAVVKHHETGVSLRIQGSAFRRKLFPACEYSKVYEETRGNLKELLRLHANLHDGDVRKNMHAALDNDDGEQLIPIYFYADGVAPSNSGTKKMFMEAFRVPCCRAMIHFATIHYEPKFDICADDLLVGLIEELKSVPQVRVALMVADLPERCRLSGLVNFNAIDGCIVCYASGESRSKGVGSIFPAWTVNQPLRDDRSFKNLGIAAEVTGMTASGVKRHSILLDIPHFSIANGLGIDPMHLLGGFTRYLLEACLEQMGGPQADRITEAVSKIYTRFVVPGDFKRGVRPLHMVKFKWNEWKAVLLLMGLDLGELFEDKDRPDLGTIWRLYTFSIRAMAQGDEWYKNANKNGDYISATISQLYLAVEEALGKDHCTANLHNLSHLPMWRDK